MDSTIQDGIVLRSGTVHDATAAAALHAGQISEGFLSILGPKFLRRLYRRVALHGSSFLLMVETGGSPVGFLAGSTDVAALYRAFLWRDAIAAVFACGGRLVRSWRRVMETLRYGADHAGQGAELLAVAVDPVTRGRGAGTLLVKGFLTEIRRQNLEFAYVVVEATNETAIALYRRAGFDPVQRFQLHRGTESLVMQWAGGPTSRT